MEINSLDPLAKINSQKELSSQKMDSNIQEASATDSKKALVNIYSWEW